MAVPKTILIGEAPPRAGLGPLGAFDCDSGERLALYLHEAATAAEDPAGAIRVARPHVEAALGLLDRRNLLAAFPGRRGRGADGGNRGDAWPEAEAREAAAAMLPELAGRRVAFAGRRVAAAFEAAGPRAGKQLDPAWNGIGGLPLHRWVAFGGPGEPAEVCVVSHPSPTNRELNPGKPSRAALGRWLLAERERAKLDALWMRVDAETVYRYSDGAFMRVRIGGGTPSGTPGPEIDPARAGPEWRGGVLRQLAVNCAGQGRFTGRGMGVTPHHLLVAELGLTIYHHHSSGSGDRAALARLGAELLTHDLREGLTHDVTPYLKRRHAGFAGDERRAAEAVDRLLGLEPASPAIAALVHRVDVMVRELESAVLWGTAFGETEWDAEALGDPGRWLGLVHTFAERDRRGLVREWAEQLEAVLEELGRPLPIAQGGRP